MNNEDNIKEFSYMKHILKESGKYLPLLVEEEEAS